MYSFKGSKHPKIFYEKSPNEKGVSIDETRKINSQEEPGKLGTMELIAKTKDLISKAETSNNINVKLTYNLLVATGAITTGFSGFASLVMRWKEGSGRSGAEAIIRALENAEKGLPIEIVLYSKGSYKTIPLRTYETQVSKDVGMLNGGEITKGLFELYKTGSGNSFSESTWAKIGIYLKGKAQEGKESRIISNLPLTDVNAIIALGEKQVSLEKEKIEAIIKPIVEKFGKDNPKLKEILKNNEGISFKNGIIDLNPLFKKAKEKGDNITDLIKVFEDARVNFENEAKVFDEISKTSLEKHKKRSFKEIFLSIFRRKKKNKDGKEEIIDNKPSNIDIKGLIGDKSVETLNINDINRVLPLIQIAKSNIKSDNSNQDKELHLQILYELEQGLTAKREKHAALARAAQARDTGESLEKVAKQGGNIDTAIQKIPVYTKRLESVNAVALDRSQLNDTAKSLEKYGITSLEKAQEKLKELENPKNDEEIKLKADIISYIQDNTRLARSYIIAKQALGENTAQEIFTNTNRYIGGNPAENYNFKSLEKIAIITDPESTIGEKSLAQLEPGKNISIQRALSGEIDSNILNTPEINSLGSLSMNQNGTYNIPGINQQNLTEPQLKECLTDIKNYAELGLSQFIPHLTTIGSELRKKGINTAIDGNSGTMEQQQVLKSLYTQLFGKNIETTNLGDVQRAFASALGNPTNMRNAMQHVLKTHNLISESGGAISTERLQKWFQENNTDPLLNLT